VTEKPHSPARARGNNVRATAEALQQDAFLAAYEVSGSISVAAERAGIERRRHYQWMTRDAAYVERWKEADQVAVQALVDEAKRRAVDGVVTPKTVAGEAIDVIEYSDRLLEFLIKGRRPEIYGDRMKSEISGPAGGPIQVSAVDLSRLTTDQLRALKEMAEQARLPEASE
jgi:uncharacterized protein YbjQ (UPF0145 family)